MMSMCDQVQEQVFHDVQTQNSPFVVVSWGSP